MNFSSTGRTIALDVGMRRIGIAISDALGITAQGLPTLERTRIREDLQHLDALAKDREAVRFVLGHPLHMSGCESRQAGHVKEFGARLAEYTGLPVEYRDERLTTVEAGRVLRSSGIGREKRAKAVDKLSAVLILESYLATVAISEEGGGDV